MKFNPVAFIINIAIPLAVGAIGAFFTASSVKTWYVTLAKPSFNPPNEIFAPVWTSLYILMGISAYLVWQKRHTITQFPRTIAIYLIQLVLNLMWSFIFFYAHQLGVALFEIIALLLAVIINAWVFYKINKVAGLLFIPYILWVSFATVLTYNIFILN
ncbi:TspO/MBR family protein [Pedobacter heparinus]|uniref:TspO/MBR family protein n=1 Tax=Pedobacter heparinus TaxID=984 RepID=UPI002930411B|nr:TspO/MBR family protein [Pedobacter heparinus]